MDWLSGGILFLVGAALWVAYLLPEMARRRRHEANGLDTAELQLALQTIVETGELPEVEPSEHDRLAERRRQHKIEKREERENLRALHAAELARKAAARAEREAEHEAERAAKHDAARERKAAARNAHDAPHAARSHDIQRRRSRLKRWRTLASWLLLLSLLTGVGGGVAMLFGASWMIAAGGALGFVIAVVALRQIVRGLAKLVSATSAVAAAGASAGASPRAAFQPIELPTEQPAVARRWTPHALPHALHLAEGSQAAATIASTDALEALRRQAREIAARDAATATPRIPSVTAARAQRAASARPPVAPHPTVSAQTAEARQAPAAAQVTDTQLGTQSLSRAELIARRYVSSDPLSDLEHSTIDVSLVLQRRRVG